MAKLTWWCVPAIAGLLLAGCNTSDNKSTVAVIHKTSNVTITADTMTLTGNRGPGIYYAFDGEMPEFLESIGLDIPDGSYLHADWRTPQEHVRYEGPIHRTCYEIYGFVQAPMADILDHFRREVTEDLNLIIRSEPRVDTSTIAGSHLYLSGFENSESIEFAHFKITQPTEYLGITNFKFHVAQADPNRTDTVHRAVSLQQVCYGAAFDSLDRYAQGKHYIEFDGIYPTAWPKGLKVPEGCYVRGGSVIEEKYGGDFSQYTLDLLCKGDVVSLNAELTANLNPDQYTIDLTDATSEPTMQEQLYWYWPKSDGTEPNQDDVRSFYYTFASGESFVGDWVHCNIQVH